MDKPQDPEGIEALYAEKPDRFVAARNALAERLRDADEPDAAKRVAALRRPTVAAWAVDVLARDHPRELEALIAAGNDVASAQREVAAGGSVERLRETADERRRLVDRLVRASGDVLKGAGMSAPRATLDKVANTLMAIATDREAAERVRRGILDKELPAPAGFGDERLDTALLASVSPLSSKAERRSRTVARAERLAAEALTLEEDADRLEREAKEEDARAVAAKKSAAAARGRAVAARRKADEAL